MLWLRTAFLVLLWVSQALCGTERNASKLIPNFFNNADPALRALLPPTLVVSDAVIQVRFALFYNVLIYDLNVPCDPAGKALNFWGRREVLPAEVCSDPETPAVMFAYGFLRGMAKDYPSSSATYAEFMRAAGFDPEDLSTDMSTAIGMANVVGTRAANWFAMDGWNSQGDLTRSDFKEPFEDYTNYTPVNTPWSLRKPLRWQPLVQPDRISGRFNTQTHVTPFLGGIRPLLLTREEVGARRVQKPYENMNARSLRGKDRETIASLVQDLFEASANLTSFQRVQARYFENKFLSIGFVLIVHTINEGFDPMFNARWGLGEMMAMYDASILAWKEKRRIDAVRPESVIKEFFKDDLVSAWVPAEGKVKTIKAGDWRPLIPTQSHSEHPSATACICSAFAEHGEIMMQEHMRARNLTKEPPFVFDATTIFTPDFYEDITEFRYDSIKEIGRLCGESRIWGGVHFGPSVPAGTQLVEGLGRKAHDFVKQLSEGVRPDNCWWCVPN